MRPCTPPRWSSDVYERVSVRRYLPFYLFDMEVDVYFKGKLAGRKGYTDEYVFRKVRYHSDGSANSAVDMMVYGSYSYRRNYAHAIKNVNLEAADPVKSALASVSLGSIAESYPPVDRGGVHERPDLDPFEMSQTFAFDMVQERMLKNAKQLAFEYLNKTLGLGAVVDTRVAFKIRRRQCTPMFLPAYVFEYKYLGVRYRALVRPFVALHTWRVCGASVMMHVRFVSSRSVETLARWVARLTSAPSKWVALPCCWRQHCSRELSPASCRWWGSQRQPWRFSPL